LHYLCNTPAGSLLTSMATLLLGEDAREEGINYSSASRGTAAERRRKRSRECPSSSVQHSEVIVRGLEGINAGRNHFQERHVSTADASRSTAENIRSILQAIRDVKSMINGLPLQWTTKNPPLWNAKAAME
jgi:hypothetical protein